MRLSKRAAFSTYMDNLCRLGILERPPFAHMTTPNTYEPLENDPELDEIKNTTIDNSEKGNIEFDRRMIKLTTFGKQFIDSVVREKEM